MPVDINRLSEGIKNRQLQQQVNNQRTKVGMQGGTVKKGGPSILSRIFDVISRPIYGVSEGIARASEHLGSATPQSRKGKNPIFDILEGMGKGVAGVNKTYMGDALKRAAEADPGSLTSKAIRENKGNLRTIAGFGGDVLLDPVTWTGAGVVKQIGAGAAKTAGMKAGAKAVETVDNVRRVTEAADAAKKARLAKGVIKPNQTAADVAKIADRVADRAVKSELRIIRKEGEALARAKELELLASNPGKVTFKFAGKKIGESEKLYKGTSSLGKMVGDTRVGNWFSEAFKTAHKFPEKTLRFKREAELRGIAHADIEIREMRKFFKDVAKDDKILISHTMEKGADAVNSLKSARPELAPLIDKAKEMQRTMGELEVHHGVFRAPKNKDPKDFLLDDYVYHSYQGGNKEARKKFKKMRRSAVGPESPNFTKQRTVPTLEEAKKYGLDPIENIDDILAKRIGKHHAAMSRVRYVDAVTKEYGVNVGSKWATQMARDAKKAGTTTSMRRVNSKYVPKDVVFPEHIAKSIEVLEEMHKSDELYNSFLKVFDAAQNHWKFGATSLNPGHHIRNLMGDGFNGFLDGVKDPRHYQNASKILFGKDDNFKLMVNGKALSRPQIMDLYINSGTKPGFVALDLAEGKSKAIRNIKKPFNTIAEKREEYMRMAHFIHALKEEAPKFKNLTEAASEAGARVRKWKLDYGDITDFERNVMKRAIPFYTWTRKNIPLQIEALAMTPGRIAVLPKGTTALETLLGTREPGGEGVDPFERVPKWMKEMAPIRLRGEGEGKNAIYWLPAVPFQDVSRYLEGGQQGIAQSILSQVTPGIRAPFEVATGKQVFSGAPVKGNLPMATNQVPLARMAHSAATGKLTGLKALNYLTGAGVHEVTPAAVAGELRRQQDPLQSQLRSIKEKYRKRVFGG